MQYIISGKNIDVTEGLKAAVQDKLGKLERYFTPETEDRDYHPNERKYRQSRAGQR